MHGLYHLDFFSKDITSQAICQIKLKLVEVIGDLLNPFVPNLFSHPFQLDESISNFKVVGCFTSVLFQI